VVTAHLDGTLVLVGGGALPPTIRQRFLELAGGPRARILIIPTASGRPDAAARSYAFWKTSPVQSVRILHTTRRAEADDPRFYGQLRDATGVWISGGDQTRLMAVYGGTPVERELAAVLRRGGVVGGTSAGASVVCSVMMVAGRTGKGFGLIDHTIVDQHFNNRQRLDRLQRVLHTHPDQLGIGIDEKTAVIIHGTDVSVLGNDYVTVAWPDNSKVDTYRTGGHFQLPGRVSLASR
jgi:cyanophycinase